jgi:UDP-N-acetylmuramate dehydrogenase
MYFLSPNLDIKTISLKDHSSLRVGGEGKCVEIQTTEGLKEAVMYAKAEGLSPHILGGGTNSYFGEDLSHFLFIKLPSGGIEYQEEGDDVFVKVGANVVWDDLVEECVEKGLWGIENLSYIPGTVSAAPVQNIGAYGMELKESFVSLLAFDMETQETKTLDRESCRFGYRDSLFKYEKEKYIILCITLKLSKIPHPILSYKPLDALRDKEGVTLQMIRDTVIDIRTKKLPNYKEHPNAGSFFKNPIIDLETSEYVKSLYPNIPLIQVMEGFKVPAAWLIEHVAEMKGVRQGDVGTWPAQPLVIVNFGSAIADDVDAFAKALQTKINEKTSIVLEQEVNRVG